MNRWSLSAEVFSLILLSILILNYYDKRWIRYPRSRVYHLCLLTSFSSVLLNIICVFTIAHANQIALWVNLLCNSLYFLITVSVSSIIAYYLISLVFRHINKNSREQHVYSFILVILSLFYLLVLLHNLKSGCVFFFDRENLYQRGPLINLGYVIMGIQILLLIICACRHRHTLSLPMRRVIQTLPPTLLLVSLYQMLFPQVLFNGGIIATANIIILMNFQTRRIEQDTLTSVGNWHSFHQELTLRLNRHDTFQVIALCVLQLENVNRRFDYPSGDSLLFEISLWLNQLRKDGQLFRIGNTKFALIIPSPSKTGTSDLALEICNRFHHPWDINGKRLFTQASVAEYICTDQKKNAADIAELLNFSLSIAHQYKNHLVRFNDDICLQMEQQLEIIHQMHISLKQQRFEVWYQPIYNCNSHRFSSAEALIRMYDQNQRPVSPSVFIPLAEEHGLIDDISDIVLENVCQMLSHESMKDLDYISINVSMQQFMSDNLTNTFRSALKRYPAAAGRLILEITEHVLTEDMEKMRSVITELRRMGIRFSLDDFGTGYSNLSVALDCPLSYVKLDRSLIQNMKHKRSAAIVKSMLRLFHEMDFKVVAEGVENETQADALIRKGADMIQGYYYARPMPREAFVRFISCGQVPE